MKENKAMAQEIWKISILYPKTSKEFYNHIKVLEKYNEQRVLYKKTFLNNFAIFTEKNLFWCLFFNKNAGLQVCNFIENRLQHRCFLVNIAKFLRTHVLKNICEQLLLRVFPSMSVWTFPTWTNSKLQSRQRRRFLKNKTKKSFYNLARWKKLFI